METKSVGFLATLYMNLIRIKAFFESFLFFNDQHIISFCFILKINIVNSITTLITIIFFLYLKERVNIFILKIMLSNFKMTTQSK